ncbi:MAG TPA: hypothetical protein DCQ84_07060 [Candidatus Competibacteraceae bacterium]|nr:hypothetical protein [Candidatus Competibacteraceae bacterium]
MSSQTSVIQQSTFVPIATEFHDSPTGRFGRWSISAGRADSPRAAPASGGAQRISVLTRILDAITPSSWRAEGKYRRGLQDFSGAVGDTLGVLLKCADNKKLSSAKQIVYCLDKIRSEAEPCVKRGAAFQDLFKERLAIHLAKLDPRELDDLAGLLGDPALAKQVAARNTERQQVLQGLDDTFGVGDDVKAALTDDFALLRDTVRAKAAALDQLHLQHLKANLGSLPAYGEQARLDSIKLADQHYDPRFNNSLQSHLEELEQLRPDLKYFASRDLSTRIGHFSEAIKQTDAVQARGLDGLPRSRHNVNVETPKAQMTFGNSPAAKAASPLSQTLPSSARATTVATAATAKQAAASAPRGANPTLAEIDKLRDVKALYRDEQMSKLGGIYENQLRQKNPLTFFAAPISVLENNNLQKVLFDQIAQVWKQQAMDGEYQIAIPYHTGSQSSGHWTAILLKFDANPDKREIVVQYADPLGANPLPKRAKEQLEAFFEGEFESFAHGAPFGAFTRSYETVKAPYRQNDATSCGPCTMENLLAMASGIGPRSALEATDMQSLRSKQVGLMIEDITQ